MSHRCHSGPRPTTPISTQRGVRYATCQFPLSASGKLPCANSVAEVSEAAPTVVDARELLRLTDVHAKAIEGDNDILRGFSLTVREGEIHAIMGPNGSGKSTLASTLLSSPAYEVTSGTIAYKGDDIAAWSTTERAQRGIFLGFQYPQEIAGVSVLQFLRQALSARKGIDLSILELRLAAMDWMKRLGMDSAFIDRHLNQGFSGGEKKRNEIMQMAMLEPDLAILDETDSGLDIDALRIVAKGIREVRAKRPQLGIVVITHYQRLLDELQPDFVHVLVDGRIVASGGMELAVQLEGAGYDSFRGEPK